MKTNLLKIATVSATAILLCACNGFFDKDNTPTPTPLTHYRQEAQVHKQWTTFANFGEESDYLKLVPAVGGNAIFTASKDGSVTAVSKARGSTIWKTVLKAQLSAGPTVDNGKVFIGSRGGHVIALDAQTGDRLWQSNVSSEVLSPPAAGAGVVLIKTIDGELTALSQIDGRALWHYHQTEPALIVRGGSTPLIYGNDALAGFENGNLAKLTLSEGSMIWQTTVAIPQGSFAIQRMVDIDADPVIFNHTVYVATYQGKVAALDISSGKIIWSHDMSSFTGITVDNERVYVSDAKSYLWAFDRESGTVDWRQPQLESRVISGPALVTNYVTVGDGQGYLHFLSKVDGHFVARARVHNSAIRVTPVVDNGVVYVLTKEGYLSAYTIS